MYAEAIEAHLKGEVQQLLAQAANDKQQLAPMLDNLQGLPEELNQAEQRLADAGYFSEANVNTCEAADITPAIAIKRDEQDPIGRSALPKNVSFMPINSPDMPRDGPLRRSCPTGCQHAGSHACPGASRPRPIGCVPWLQMLGILVT